MIREATPDDVEPMRAIYNEAIAEGGFTGDLDPLTAANRMAWFKDHAKPYGIFVKVVNGEVGGYVTLSPYRKGRRAFAGTCEISYYLGSRHRGRGLGKVLVRRALREAGARGFATVLAVILACNERSIGLLLREGFEVCGRLPGVAWIGGERVDHVYLALQLSN